MSDDATKKRIEELRSRHVAAVEGGTEGRMMLMRQMHVEYARSEAALRARGVKLHVVRDENSTNLCPFYRRSMPLIVCLTMSSNHTSEVCFGCPYPLEWAARSGKLQEFDYRGSESLWKPYAMVRYIDGVQQVVQYEPYVYCRVEEPNGNVWWFKRFRFGQVEPDYSAHQDHSRETRWWSLGKADMAPPQSSLSEAVVEEKREAAEKKRNALNKPVQQKKKGKKVKRSADSDE